MNRNFIIQFLQAIKPEVLLLRADQELSQYPLAPDVAQKVNELRVLLMTSEEIKEQPGETIQHITRDESKVPRSPEGFSAIEREINGWEEFGNRLVEFITSPGDVSLKEVSPDSIISEFIFDDVSQSVEVLSGQYHEFIDSLYTSGLTRAEKIEELENQIMVANYKIIQAARMSLRFIEIKLLILEAVQNVLISLITELKKFEINVQPKYDYEKLSNYVENPTDRTDKKNIIDEKTGMTYSFGGIQNAWKGENYYLTEVVSKESSAGTSGSSTPEGYQQFKIDMKKLYNFEHKGVRAFTEETFFRFYEILSSYNINPIALPKDKRLKLEYGAGGLGAILGLMHETIFGSPYLGGNKTKFDQFIIDCLLNNKRSEIKSTSSIRKKDDREM